MTPASSFAAAPRPFACPRPRPCAATVAAGSSNITSKPIGKTRFRYVMRPTCAIIAPTRGGMMKTLLLSVVLLTAAPAVAQQAVPDIQFDSSADFLKLPAGTNFGEVPGVAVNSKGHIFVFTRSNSAGGPAYAPTAAQQIGRASCRERV